MDRAGGGKGRGGEGLSPPVLPRLLCPILTLAPRAVSALPAPHPLAGGLSASLPERGAPGDSGLPSLACALLPSLPPLPSAPRPRPARAALLPPLPLPGTGSLCAPAAAAAALPDPTLLLSRACAAAGIVGREGRKRGQGEGPTGVGRPFASPPSFPYTLH